MPKALEGLTIGEVSGVDHPAHLEEGWMVLKAAGATDDAIEKVEIVEALVDAVAKAAVLDPDLLSQVGAEVLDDNQRSVIKALGVIPNQAKEANSMTDEFDPSTLSPEATAWVQSEIQKAVAAATPEPASEDTEDEALLKSLDGLPEPIRKAFLDQREEVRKAREDAAAERNIRLDGEYLTKARGYQNLPVKAEDLAPVLRKVAEFDPTVFVEVDRLLKAADEAIATGDLFKSRGAVITPDADSATGQFDAVAKALVASGEATDLGDAYSKAAAQHPDLYAAHRAATFTQEG